MNKRAVVLGAGILALLGAQSVLARDTKFQVAPRIGGGRFHVTSDYSIDHVDRHVDALVLGTTVGVVTPIGVVIEGGGFLYSNVSFLGANDSHDVGGATIALGYQFESENGILVTPKFGWASWRLSEKEGQFLNPGPEAEHRLEGEDYFWELTLQKRLGRLFSLGLDLRGGKLEFGSAGSIAIIGTFEF